MDENQNKTFAEQVDAVLSGADTNISHLEVLKVTPPLLRMVGVPNLPILMTANHLRTITQDSGTESANYHGLGAELVKRLPELISDPVMIMDSISPDEKAKNSIVIVTQMVDKENRPVIGAIRLNGVGRQDSKIISANILTSAYGKDNFQSFIERNIEQGSVLYVDKEKSQALSVNPGIQFPDVMASLSFDTIIRKTNAFVNSEEENNSEITEKNEGSMTADNNNANAQAARERVQQVRDGMVKTLLEHIEKNPTDWQSGWNNIAAGAPYNGKTSTAYRGLNALYLAVLGMQRGYKDTRWVTFNQAKELGAGVKKGEKSSPVIFFEFYDRATKKAFDSRTVKDMTDEEKTEYLKKNVYAVMKYSSVFNAEQCHNFPERKEIAMSEEERANQNAKIETIISNSAAPIRYDGGNRAYYSPGTDSIHLPAIAAFDTMQDYYATALHEIAHSTGHESRLNRDLAGGFGSESYAKEELRAELACVFMQMEQGIRLNGKHITNHAAYLNSWLQVAKSDTSVFFKAAADAQKIADYVADNYLQAADGAVIEENVAQEQIEEQPERNPMAEYLRAESEKRTEETRTADRLSSGETSAQKLADARAQAKRLAQETGEPYVTIEWTEKSNGFPDINAYDVMPLSEADKRLSELDRRAEKEDRCSKTKLHIDYVFEGKPESYENSVFYIGVEGGGLVHHIDEFIKSDTFLDVQERAEAEAALEYFKRHMEVSEYLASPEKLVELSEEEQGDVNMYVSRARDALNNTEPFSDYTNHMPLTPEEIKKGRDAAHAAGLPFYEGNDEDWDAFNEADGLVYDGNMSVEDYKRMWELREQDEANSQQPYLKETRYGSPVNGIVEFPVGSGKFVAIIDNSEQKEDAFPDQYPPSFIIAHDYNPQNGEWQTGAFGFSHYEEARDYLIEHYGVDIGQSHDEGDHKDKTENITYGNTQFSASELEILRNSSQFYQAAEKLDNELGATISITSELTNGAEDLSYDELNKYQEQALQIFMRDHEDEILEQLTADEIQQAIEERREREIAAAREPLQLKNAEGNHEEKITLEQARNAMLDAQELLQNHYAVRIENVPYTDPEDGYESEEPAQVIYTISKYGTVREWKTIPLDSDVFSSDLPNGSLISYEPVEFEELEEIAKKVREPIQTFKDVLRAELEVGTERRRSEAYYDQRVEDILEEHYRTEYGLFKRDIENPKYLSGMLYVEGTFRGERIVSLTQDESGKNVAIIARRGGSFAVAEDYHTDDGRNWGRYHSFENQKAAEEFRAKNFPSAAERANPYQALAASKSPLGQEYARIKGENADSVVFYRVGDFYEVLGADAERVAEKLELTLTGRTIGTEERVPMCGVPYHAIDQYADTLAKKGENVIVADGMDAKTIKSNKSSTERKNGLPLVINLFAGPGAGKTTAALELTAALKKAGYNVEYVSEYAKELVLEKRYDLLDNQEHVTDEQYHRLDRLRNSGVQIIVTDSPVLLGKIYGEGRIAAEYDKKLSDYHESFNNFNLVVKRGEDYQQAGRRETSSQAQELDKKIISMLRNNNLFYGNYNHDEIEKTVNRINTTYTRLYGSTTDATSSNIKEQKGDHKAKIDLREKRLREYADSLRKIDLDVGNTAQTDEYYLNQAREQIAAYERSDEYQQALREDFPNDFIDDTPQDMAQIPQNQQNIFCTDFGGEYTYFTANEGLSIDDICTAYAERPYDGFGYQFGTTITAKQYKEIQSAGKGFSIDFLDDINSFTITQDGKVVDSGYLYEDLVLKYQEHQNKPVEAQERKREWLSIELPDGAVGGQYGENTMIKMPKGEFSYYAFYVPTRFLKEADGKMQLRVASDYTFRLNNDGRQVELTGQELRDSFAGKHLDKTYKRVAPSRRYAQGLANLEKNVPAELKAIPTWCCYRTQWNEEKGKKDKFIISPIDGKWTSTKEPGRWVTFEAAMKYARENNCEGLSVLLDKKYGITCIDLDKCIEAGTGKLNERASKLVEALSGTYIERSTSGNGLHIFVKDDILKNGQYNMTSTDKNKGDLEVYDDKRIMSLTGDMYSKGNTLTRAGSAATVYLRQELGERRSVSTNGAKPHPAGSLNLSDNELIRWIQSSKQGSKFNDLYNGRGVSGNRSEDDAKLAHMLLYFNGGDKEQAFRIMRESGAYRPDKPDSYYRATIDKMDAKIEVYAKRPTFSADGPGKPKGKGPGNGKKGSQA